MGETYQFWGIVLSEGEVFPANVDYGVYYTEDVIQDNLDGLVETDVRIVHTDLGDANKTKIGEVVDYSTIGDNVFVLNQIEEDLWDNFLEELEDENGFIDITFYQLTKEIDAGNLGLSAGLKNVTAATTPIHEKQVLAYDWKEVSAVPMPASPGAWAWAVDSQAETIFGDQVNMSEQNVELEGKGTEEGDVDNPPKTPETVKMGDEEFKLVPVEQAEGVECNCETDKLESEIEQLESEKEQLETLVEEFQQQVHDDVTSEIEQLNEELPESKAWEEDELDQMFESKSNDELRQQASLMRRLMPEKGETEVQQGKEDLTGSGKSKDDPQEETKERIDSVSQDLFGKGFEEMMTEIEEKEQ